MEDRGVYVKCELYKSLSFLSASSIVSQELEQQK